MTWLGGEADELIASIRRQNTSTLDVDSAVIPWVRAKLTMTVGAVTVPVTFTCSRCQDVLERRYCCQEVARRNVDNYAKLHAGCT
jgi:hypothetical protein